MYPSFNLLPSVPEDLAYEISHLPLEARLHEMMRWLTARSRAKSNLMLYLVMYDIENNKVRTQIAKYLIKKGCLRIQKSVYLAKSSPAMMNEISTTLREINGMYKNADSIFVLPVPEEKFSHMRVIGMNIEFDIVTKPKNVLVF